jgi:antitoxin of RelE/RelB toxin-antitoxin system
MLCFEKIADARSHLKDMYDSAQAGVPAVVRRSADPAVAVVKVESLKRALRALCPVDVEVRFGEGSVSVWLPGMPISAEAGDFDGAVVEFIAALRDYAELWVEDLRRYPNHEEYWGLVNLILLSDDDELREHVFGED